jgi:hypothetical protein
MFLKTLAPEYVLFSNDGPLGPQCAEAAKVPQSFVGWWADLNWLGFEVPANPVSGVGILKLLLTPVGFSKFSVQLAILFTSLAAWLFFRSSGLRPLAAVLGALAVALNSTFFSTACWGLVGHTMAIGWTFAALAALSPGSGHMRWVRTLLGGACVGGAILEGFDVGAILSLLVAAFMMFQAWNQGGPVLARAGKGVAQTLVVALFAALVAAQAMVSLIGTQIQGVAGASAEDRSKEEKWDWATQWSLPKKEALALVVPGLFGYRLDTPQGLSESLQKSYEGGNYWGEIGRDAAWDRYFAGGAQGNPPNGFIRHTGGGAYAGVLVALIAVWGALQSFRKSDSVFSAAQRRWIWFWTGTAVVALLLAFGRHAPFYGLLYQLPYFSTIRNPIKFINIFSMALTVLFALGVHGLSLRYLEAQSGPALGLWAGLKAWWRQATRFERRWTYGCAATFGVSLLGWLIYASSRPALVQYLQTVQFDASLAAAIASFSIRQAGVFVLLFALCAGAVVLVLSGRFAGKRARWGGVLLGLLLVLDLGRANRPWIIFWDYTQKYATNPILDRLREHPFEQRVSVLPFRAPSPELSLFDQLYKIEWVQHHFQYYNIQSLDLIQLPRQPEDYVAFESALAFQNSPETIHLVARRWELTNTRYLLGPAGFLPVLNEQLDGGRNRFRILSLFDVRPKPGLTQVTRLDQLTAVPTQDGPYALFEFTGALPRVQLYADWQVQTNDAATLAELTRTDFDPHTQVIVSSELPAPTSPVATNGVGSVTLQSYHPKAVVLQAQVHQPAVLLLNDRYDADWRVRVDGQPAGLLRCNYLMRGVFLEPGNHTVEFLFRPPIGGLYVSLASISLSLVLLGILLASNARPSKPVDGK